MFPTLVGKSIMRIIKGTVEAVFSQGFIIKEGFEVQWCFKDLNSEVMVCVWLWLVVLSQGLLCGRERIVT